MIKRSENKMHRKAILLISLVTLLFGICSSQAHRPDPPSADGSGIASSPTTAVYENSTNTVRFVLTAEKNKPAIVVWEFTIPSEWSFTDTAADIAGTLSEGCAGASVSVVGNVVTLTNCNIQAKPAGLYPSGSFTISDLAAPPLKAPPVTDTYIFTNRTAGSPGTLQPISPPVANDVSINVVTSAIDIIPPATITNLTASTGRRAGEVDLTWTAPGDNGMEGTATTYIIKYTDKFLIDSDAKFKNASPVANPPLPQPGGSPESFTVTGLTPGVLYYFAIVTEDEVTNASGISVSPSAVAQQPVSISLTASPLTLVADGTSISIVTATVVGVDGKGVAGETVTMVVTVGTGTIGPVTDNGDGTYSAIYTASTVIGAVTITATDLACVSIKTATVDIKLTAGPPDVITVIASPLTLMADGTSTSIVTATVVDAYGHLIAGETVTMAVTVGTGAIGPVTDNGDGTYSAIYTASTTPGTETITATDTACLTTPTATVDISLVAVPVATAIDNGIAWLCAQQQHLGTVPEQGYWFYGYDWLGNVEGEVGITAMAALALLNYGADPVGVGDIDVDLKEGLEFILNQMNPNGSFGDEPSHEVYQTSTALWALLAAWNVTGPALRDSRWEPAIIAGANYLITAQNDAGPYLGGWPYGLYEKNWWGDLSNTQYALLALKAAERAGLILFDTKAAAIAFVGICQNPDGGFTYQDGWSPHVDGYEVSYGSMSAAGVWSLWCCDVLTDTHPNWNMVINGVNWLRNNVGNYDVNPPIGEHWYYYYVMALAKAFAFYPDLAPANWYDDLSAHLVQVQNLSGSWGPTWEPVFGGEPEQMSTVQALLTLQTQATVFQGWMRVVLSTYADLHVYDPSGRHVGINYETGKVELEIPGATYSGPGTTPQIITVPRLPAGCYTIEAVGKASEWYTLAVETYLGDKLISAEMCREEITQGEVKEHSVIVASVIGPLELYTDFPAPPSMVMATVDFDPDTLNLGSRGRWVTCYIEVPVSYNVENIDLNTIRLSGIDYNLENELVDVEVDIPIDSKGPTAIGDYDGDAVPDLMVKFDRKQVADSLKVSDRVGLRVEGFVGATFFEGRATIRVIGNGDEGTGSGRPHRPREELLLNVWR